MMIKIGSDYLDFDGEVEVERKIKLFEDISTSDGDFSYQFDVQKTSKNMRLLNYPVPDSISKSTYHRIDCDLLDEQNITVYSGFLKIERVTKDVISVSFFSGNSNWFGMLNGLLTDLDFSELDIDLNVANIIASIPNTDGVVFPLVDNGALHIRGNTTLKAQDFLPGIYVKTIFHKIFTNLSIKLTGDLMSDSTYNSVIIMTAADNQSQIDARSTFARVTNADTDHGTSTYKKIVFSDDSNYPYYDGSQNNFSIITSRYTADIRMDVKVKFVINNLIIPIIFEGFIIAFYVNGVNVSEYFTENPAEPQPMTYETTLTLNAGDYLEVFVLDDADTFSDPITDATLEVIPLYIYKVFGNSAIPSWTQGEFVASVLQLFNVLTSYNQYTKTLTIDIFDKIKTKTPTDISMSIEQIDVDYTDFISNYGKRNQFLYDELEADDDFRFTKFPYQAGEILVDNDFLSETADVIESDFTNPIGYLNPVFDCHMEKLDLLTLSSTSTSDFTAVFDQSGIARFTIVDAERIFKIGDLVRISNSRDPRYNGDWVINNIDTDHVDPGWIELEGVGFFSDSIGDIALMRYEYTNNDNVFILHHVPSYTVPNISGKTTYKIETTDTSDISYAFFNVLNTGRQLNEDYKLSLSFSGDDHELHYQRTMLEQYYNVFARVLNDPVKLIANAYLSNVLYRQLDLLHPVMITSEETSTMYYLNLISGYKNSYETAVLELIKLP